MELSTMMTRAQQQRNATANQFDTPEFFVGRLEEYERALLFVARILKSTTTNGSFRNVEDPGNISPSEPCFSG